MPEFSESLEDDSELTGDGSELSEELEDSSSLFVCSLRFCVLLDFFGDEVGEASLLVEDFGDE